MRHVTRLHATSGAPASTRGFGLVFSDVEREGAASIKLFDAGGPEPGYLYAEPQALP